MDTCWIERPMSLFKNISFIPRSRENHINCITRLVIVLFLIMYLSGYTQSVLFLILSIFFIIILYYLQKDKMSKSTYEPYEKLNYIQQSSKLYNEGKKEYRRNRYTVEKTPSYFTNQRIEANEVVPNTTFVSKNQRLVGPANPKTLVAPVVAPPSYDWTHWKANDFVFPSIINEKRTQDYYGSGYFTSDETSGPIIEHFSEHPSSHRSQQSMANTSTNNMTNTSIPSVPSSQPYYENEYVAPQKPLDILGNYNGKYPTPINNGGDMGTSNVVPKDFLRRRHQTPMDATQFKPTDGILKYPGDVNRSCTYDPSNIEYDLPTNYMAGNCERNNKVRELNHELFTSTVTPGVYYNTQIIEPLNSNIGISFDQQIPPRQVTRNKAGDITYTAMDPSLYSPVPEPDRIDYGTAAYEVTDPRTNGYGTSYREYQHDITGQPRFYYDDVNAARRPNYIIRTNIDHLLKADSYGVVQSDQDIMSRNCQSRNIAEQGLLNDTLDFRTDMMTRLMRKTNAEAWQKRLAPIY